MTGVNGSAQWTPSNAIAQPVLVDGCHIILETSHPDYMEKISRYLEDSVAPCDQNQGCNDPAGADSDSGDSLFLTQEPVPEAVRTGRRRHYYKSRSDPGSPSDLLESEDDDCHGESKAGKERRRKTCRLPKYNFPFLTERKWKSRSSLLPVQQNMSLHNHTMAGFFKCVRELWQGYQREETMESSLPTVDRDGEYISPLSEEEEERSEDEGIKVVEKKCFVVLSKAKRQQTWNKQLKQQRRTKTNDARQKKMEKTQGRQWKMLHKTPAKPFISKVTQLSSDTSDHGEFSGKGPVEKERNHECVRSDVNVPAQTETPKTERRLTRRKSKILQKAREEELQSSPKQCTQKDRETSTTETEAQTCAFHKDDDLPQTGQAEESQHLHLSLPDLISDTNDDRVCADTGVKKRKKKKKDKGGHESGEEGQGQQSQEEPRGLDAATCVTVELEETPSLSEDNGAEPPAPQPSDELQINENNCMEKLSQDDNALSREEGDIPDSKQKKQKRKKKASVEEEVSGNLESDVRMTDSVFSVSCNGEDSGQVKKKKKKRKRSAEDAGQSVAEPLNNVAAIEKEKKQRKKEGRILITEECVKEEVSNGALDQPPMSPRHLEEYGHCLESTAPSEETLESTYFKRKKHKKKHQPSTNDACQDGEMVADVSFSNDALTLSENVGMPLKKKKKKKKEKTLSEDVEISQTPEENEKVENLNNTQKTKEGLEDTDTKVTKKKKRKMREISSSNISEDGVAQSDDSVSVWKKEKKGTSSFLVADAEETDAAPHVEPNCPSQLADAHVWGAERPVSPAGFRTESAEVAGNLDELNGRVRKKKKKRKMSVGEDRVEKHHGQNFEEPNETCLSPLPENTNAEVKRKKKRTRNESESVTPVERLESSADVGHSPSDEAVVLKKKKKKKCQDEHCYVMQESPPTATQSTLNNCRSASHKKGGKQLTDPLAAESDHGRTAEISHDGGTSDQATTETMSAVDHASPSSETNQASNDRRDKKKKKKLKSADSPEGTKSAELVPQENKKKKKKERNEQSAVPSLASSSPVLSETSLSKCKMSSSDSVVKKQVKRRLHNPNEDFLTDC
ncbi:hypothetical protein L3Q82_022083 [Scortum barcoo]|uniref:Uncharacterized protein n=1 Tax=Scortum barcoo TaxID=214431 RepID=A0ACB8X0H3_9TELE|nr:hypothetical protein L3Q82_022083 [Scortum barcoo]